MGAEVQQTLKRMDATLRERSRRLYPEAMLANMSSSTDDLSGSKSMIPEITTAMGTSWTILCGALVMFMHAGFALLETGVCRAVSCQSILLKNILNVCFGTMIWVFCGYAFMYGSAADGTPNEVIGGDSGYFAAGMVDAGEQEAVIQVALSSFRAYL